VCATRATEHGTTFIHKEIHSAKFLWTTPNV
jgi:hypothetical protein